MIKVQIEGMTEAVANVTGLAKQLRFATAVALTNTAKLIQKEMPAIMDKQLDRPTPFTKTGMFVTRADKENLTAVVGFKDRQAGYLAYQIDGGTRRPGAHGIKLPGNITLNAFGNIPKGTINKLKQAAQSGDLSAAIRKRLGVGGRRKNQLPIELFYGRPTGSRWQTAPIGIWRRVPGQPGKLIPVILFEQKAMHYRPRFRFEQEGARIVSGAWDRIFTAALDNAIKTAR